MGEEDESQLNLPVGDRVCCVGAGEELQDTLLFFLSRLTVKAQRHTTPNRFSLETAAGWFTDTLTLNLTGSTDRHRHTQDGECTGASHSIRTQRTASDFPAF